MKPTWRGEGTAVRGQAETTRLALVALDLAASDMLRGLALRMVTKNVQTICTVKHAKTGPTVQTICTVAAHFGPSVQMV